MFSFHTFLITLQCIFILNIYSFNSHLSVYDIEKRPAIHTPYTYYYIPFTVHLYIFD